MNNETILSYLNTPIENFFKDEIAIENAKSALKKYESFDTLLKDRVDLFNECKDMVLLELCKNLTSYEQANRDYIIGFKQGLDSLQVCYNQYHNAREYLRKEGV